MVVYSHRLDQARLIEGEDEIGIHAPNERTVMSQFWKGLLAAGELLAELGG